MTRKASVRGKMQCEVVYVKVCPYQFGQYLSKMSAIKRSELEQKALKVSPGALFPTKTMRGESWTAQDGEKVN